MRRDTYIRIRGGMLERLIGIAMEMGATFAVLKRTDAREMTLACDIHSAEILLELCRKYRIDAKILRFHGLYALWLRIRARWTLFPALMLAFVAMSFFFGRIWIIDIAFVGTNAADGDADLILSLIEESGVTIGSLSGNISTGVLEKQLMAELGDYSYIGANIEGVRLSIEAAPEVPAPEVYDIGVARDLVAMRDGVIESIEVHSGTACVSVGDTVRKGQILILGEERKSEEESAAVSALGEVYARCWFEGSASTEKSTLIYTQTGNERTSRTLRLFSMRIPLIECESFASEDIETQILPLVGLYLPVEIERCTHLETQGKAYESDDDALIERLKILAQSDALSKLSVLSGAYSVRACWIDDNSDEDTIGVRIVYEISTDIAVSRNALAKEDY